MESSEESRLNAALRRGLRGIEGLSESARFADQNITRYLRQKLGELLLSEYKRRSYRNEDETAIVERSTQALDDVVLDAQKLYRLFELHVNNREDEFWEKLNRDRKTGSAAGPVMESGKAVFSDSYSTNAPRPVVARRRFYCTEGCVFEGESAYREHRDRGHHPVPV